ncbi:S-adenosyl-L-methionine-dependent methyltransferase [Sporodiniella umbellata]|nr:S-adenosyl-L-methionine-dependent methyltransferase [Sporodiniella umbellata]
MGNISSQNKRKSSVQSEGTFLKKSNTILSLSLGSGIHVSKNISYKQTNSSAEEAKTKARNTRQKSLSATNILVKSPKSKMTKSEGHLNTFKGNQMKCPKSNYRYCLPVEDNMQDYLMNAHFVIKQLFGGNFSAPVNGILSKSVSVAKDIPRKPSGPITPPIDGSFTNYPKQDTVARVLDVVCGAGTWTMEMACTYPDSQFYGIDYDTAYPTSIKPPNTHFSTHDNLGSVKFPFENEHFDYINMRFVWSYFSESDLKFVMSEINRVLKPGGYFEMRDCDPVLKNTGPLGLKLYEGFSRYIKQHHGIDVAWLQQLPSIFSLQAGFTDIHHQVMPIAFEESGPMSKCVNNFLIDGIKSYKPLFVDSCGIHPEECDALIHKTIKEALRKRSYFNFYICWGRKPLTVEKLMATYPTQQNNQDLMLFANRCTDYEDATGLFSCSPPTQQSEPHYLPESVDDICRFSRGFVE